MSTPRGRTPERIGEILKERIGALGWEARLREERLLDGWEAVVGLRIAAHARPSHIANRRLTIVTENPVWTQQLILLKAELLRRIAADYGPEAVTDLYFVTGSFPRQPETPTPVAARPAAPVVLPAALESELQSIGDPGVREAVRQLMLAAQATAAADTPAAGER